MTKRVVFAILMATVVLFACSAGGKSENNTKKTNEVNTVDATETSAQTSGVQRNKADADTSYSFGLILALMGDLNQIKLDYDYDELVQGFRDTVEGNTPKFPVEEAYSKIQAAIAIAVQQMTEENKQKEAEYLSKNGARSGVITTASGLQYEVITEGTGLRPTINDTVEVNYEGTLIDGTVFDSSYERGEPIMFSLNQVIRGWIEGIQLMTTGSTYRFVIPSNLAYGEQGNSSIPPYSTLIFKVELLSIVK
jgi:FKBP-type peptidyl-prolyl cis-trans isomerase